MRCWFVFHKPLPFPFALPGCFGERCILCIELKRGTHSNFFLFFFVCFPPVCVPLPRGVNIERAPHTEE